METVVYSLIFAGLRALLGVQKTPCKREFGIHDTSGGGWCVRVSEVGLQPAHEFSVFPAYFPARFAEFWRFCNRAVFVGILVVFWRIDCPSLPPAIARLTAVLTA